MISIKQFKNTVLLLCLAFFSCLKSQNIKDKQNNKPLYQGNYYGYSDQNRNVTVGANRLHYYLPELKGKRIGVVANQTSVIFKSFKVNDTLETYDPEEDIFYEVVALFDIYTDEYTHLVDSLISLDVNVKKVFAPEHGFRGTADAGETVIDGVDKKTGVPIISLYGKNKKPSPEQLQGLDMLIFDIQDVGARFYTYISTLHYVMEACTEAGLPLLILDRPNPNGFYVDGPVLEIQHKSFVGMHPVPVVHGMTVGEYAQMINGEKWLTGGIQCDITVIECIDYSKSYSYSLPIFPSPNLPNDKAINLYPSLCFFEGTHVSVGRGTDMQFQVYGSPFLPESGFSFIPQPNGGAKYPLHEGKKCYGEDLRAVPDRNYLDLSWLIKTYQATTDKTSFFNSFFTKLAGTTQLQEQIELGNTEETIKETWEADLEKYKTMRKKYLIYN
ncbi:DUF1343 domain-containing protein [Leptobacterium sp. I13]|uniref:exo-beta-N-acetylmuramidase NamZ family protein n=1 Tax=Leptobacterium meishanense TaxID=3128904 RepID=UPI0030EDFADB